jgi:ubiquinone/menaquinone biosynthesis C-methylase UbiE
MRVYKFGGRIYESLTSLLTFGRVDRFKRMAMSKLGIQPGQRILDWGCGTGISSQLALSFLEGRGEVHGVEISPGMLKLAVARSRPTAELGFTFTLRTGFDLQLVKLADHAIACHTLGVLPGALTEEGVREVYRNLKPGARIMFTDMYIPDASGVVSNTNNRVTRFVAEKIYRQDFSGTLLEVVQRYFTTIELEYNPGLMAFYFIGERKDHVDGVNGSGAL